MRFSRDYELTIILGDETVIVRPPIRVVFSADLSITGGLSKMTLQVYNLREGTRLRLVKDAEEAKRIPITLKVGYQGALGTVFKGTVHTGSNSRVGSDFVSVFECLDGGFDYLNSYTNKTVRGKSQALRTILKDMPNTTRGKITDLSQTTRPKVLVGNSVKLIEGMLGEGETYYIDKEQLYIIKPDSEVISSFIPVITAQSGLINTPQRKSQQVTFNTMMNPSLKIGGLAQLLSVTAPHLNDTYKIRTINYNGDYDGDAWFQSVTCLAAKGYTIL